MDRIFIYGLSDPRTPANVRYVGRTRDLTLRLARHRAYYSSNGRKREWIAGLKQQGLMPTVIVLDTVPANQADEAEANWIARYAGPALLNASIPLEEATALRAVDRHGLVPTLEMVEKRYILGVLKRCQWNKLLAARLLGIGRQTLYNKVADYGLRP